MTADTPIGLKLIEKLLGITLIIIGALVALDSSNPPPGDISHVSGIFTILGIVILIAGIILLAIKVE